MLLKLIIKIMLLIILLSCTATGANKTDREALSPEIRELNAFRVEASLRSAGVAYKETLGQRSSIFLEISSKLSEKLLEKGYGTGKLVTGLSKSEKTELSNILGDWTNEQVEKFLDTYHSAMDKEMESFYLVKGIQFKKNTVEKKNENIWDEKIYSVKNDIVAYATGVNELWRSYRVCVKIPDKAFMLKNSVKYEVIKGVGAGPWGNWANDLSFTDNNDFGPTKVCITFQHQIHDQDRLLRISVDYKLPKK